MPIRVNVVQVCDARDDDTYPHRIVGSSTTAGKINKIEEVASPPLADRKKIEKVKTVSSSPFYDGKYHPPLLGQFALPYILRYISKIDKKRARINIPGTKLCT